MSGCRYNLVDLPKSNRLDCPHRAHGQMIFLRATFCLLKIQKEVKVRERKPKRSSTYIQELLHVLELVERVRAVALGPHAVRHGNEALLPLL